MPRAHNHDQAIGRVNAILDEHSSHDIFLSKGIVEEECDYDPDEELYLDELEFDLDEVV